jgi:aromatic-L-amino-acid decarboxylase
MIGELLASAVSNPGFSWICSPACTELEQVVLDWCAKMFGLDDGWLLSGKKGGGIIIVRLSCVRRTVKRVRLIGQESASITCLTAATGARERTLRYLAKSEAGDKAVINSNEAFDVPQEIREKYGQKLVIYGSTQTHSIAKKAAVILGLEFRAVPVSIEDNYGLRGEALRKAMKADVEAGYVPFFVGQSLLCEVKVRADS